MLKLNVDYGFSISIFEDGRQVPGFGFYNEIYLGLNHFAGQIEFVYSKNVKEIIDGVTAVIAGKLEKYCLGSDPMLDVDILDKLTKTYEYHRFYPDDKVIENEFPTSDFLFFLEEWYTFLVKYENNEIPNLKYAFHSDGVVIYRGQMK